MRGRLYAPNIPTRVRQPNEMGLFERKRFWRHHQENFANLVLLQGISIKAYAKLYRLELRLAYVKFRTLGSAELRRKFWEQHRQQFQSKHAATGISVDTYIQEQGLGHKTARLELKRQPMSQEWELHCRRYALHHEHRGITIAQYAKENNLNPSTARRYIRKK